MLQRNPTIQLLEKLFNVGWIPPPATLTPHQTAIRRSSPTAVRVHGPGTLTFPLLPSKSRIIRQYQLSMQNVPPIKFPRMDIFGPSLSF